MWREGDGRWMMDVGGPYKTTITSSELAGSFPNNRVPFQTPSESFHDYCPVATLPPSTREKCPKRTIGTRQCQSFGQLVSVWFDGRLSLGRRKETRHATTVADGDRSMNGFVGHRFIFIRSPRDRPDVPRFQATAPATVVGIYEQNPNIPSNF